MVHSISPGLLFSKRCRNFVSSGLVILIIFPNAVYHKAYDEREPIEVRVEKNMIEIISHPGPDRSVTLEGLRTFKVRSRRYRNRRIGEFLKELHLTEGRNTGFKKILDALQKNVSPLPEFETDEAHDYFITRLFVRNGFYDYQNTGSENVVDNVIENVVDNLPATARYFLESYSPKKREVAKQILAAIAGNQQITISQMAEQAGITSRTVQRYLKDFQIAGFLRRTGSDINGEWLFLS